MNSIVREALEKIHDLACAALASLEGGEPACSPSGEAEELAREMENCSTNTIAPTKQWAARVRSLPRLADAAPLVEALGRAEWYWFNAEEDAACWYVCPDCGATSDDRKTAKHYAECIIDAALTTYRKQTGATPE